MDRDQVLEIIDKAYAARASGDPAALAPYWAAEARFEVAGEKTLLDAFPAGPGAAHAEVSSIMDLVAMSGVQRLQAVVEGHRAAVLSRATVSFAGRPPFETLLYDLFELDDDGRIRALTQFADTAKVASEMQALASA